MIKKRTFLNDYLLFCVRLRSSAWLEHWTFNPGVGGSNPSGAIIPKRFLKDSILIIIRIGARESAYVGWRQTRIGVKSP